MAPGGFSGLAAQVSGQADVGGELEETLLIVQRRIPSPVIGASAVAAGRTGDARLSGSGYPLLLYGTDPCRSRSTAARRAGSIWAPCLIRRTGWSGPRHPAPPANVLSDGGAQDPRVERALVELADVGEEAGPGGVSCSSQPVVAARRRWAAHLAARLAGHGCIPLRHRGAVQEGPGQPQLDISWGSLPLTPPSAATAACTRARAA